ncbi:hypothetical protein P43SY_006777 [Pythium insidiosum]|uniref:PX domain-containing protein n=1 Tax=Pythium insidiosum TaxID=114742 RepID=A0AAD5LTT5_PYTIN|nr:hypothetical protein P43SY_006777 [Pythium insidiosum]
MSCKTSAAPRELPPSRLSRGQQLEAAVDNLSAWYFELDEPKSEWHAGLIHPLPEESAEPQDDGEQDDDDGGATALESAPAVGGKAVAPATQLKPTAADVDVDVDRHVDEEEHAAPKKKPHTTSESTAASTPLSASGPESMDLDRMRRRSDRQSTRSARTATLASMTASTYTDLVVTGYTTRGSEKKVMYHIDVRGHESQLQTYTIRRSFTDFKHLHLALTEILEARREHHVQTVAYMARHKITASTVDARASSDAAGAGTASGADDESGGAWFMSFSLPPLPHAGFLSFWKRHDRQHLQHRCEVFQDILRAAMRHPDLRESYAMQNFLSVAPCAIRERGSSYVSLCEYSVPKMDFKEETRERKKFARERRRNSSAHASFLME